MTAQEEEAQGYGAWGCGIGLTDNPHNEIPQDVIDAMGDDYKGYFAGMFDETLPGYLIGDRVEDQEW